MARPTGPTAGPAAPATLHQQLRDLLQVLPMAIKEHERRGRRWKAWVLRRVSTPVLKAFYHALTWQRFRGRGQEAKKITQAEQMRRHLELRRQAQRHVQQQIEQAQRRKRR